jgi:hypothetical protein
MLAYFLNNVDGIKEELVDIVKVLPVLVFDCFNHFFPPKWTDHFDRTNGISSVPERDFHDGGSRNNNYWIRMAGFLASWSGAAAIILSI